MSFIYFSNIPCFGRQELSFWRNFFFFLICFSIDIHWFVACACDTTYRYKWRPERLCANRFFLITCAQKLYFWKPNLSAYTCTQNLYNAAIVFNRRIKISMTKNSPFGFSTKTLCLLINFHNESHLPISRHHKEIKQNSSYWMGYFCT